MPISDELIHVYPSPPCLFNVQFLLLRHFFCFTLFISSLSVLVCFVFVLFFSCSCFCFGEGCVFRHQVFRELEMVLPQFPLFLGRVVEGRMLPYTRVSGTTTLDMVEAIRLFCPFLRLSV